MSGKISVLEISCVDLRRTYGTDARNGQSLPDDLGSNPISLNYLWLVFPDDGTETGPQVIEIRPNP